MTEIDYLFYALLWLSCIFFIAILLIGIFQTVRDFCYELKNLNREILRSTGDERSYWLQRRRRLWLSLLPFIEY